MDDIVYMDDMQPGDERDNSFEGIWKALLLTFVSLPPPFQYSISFQYLLSSTYHINEW